MRCPNNLRKCKRVVLWSLNWSQITKSLRNHDRSLLYHYLLLTFLTWLPFFFLTFFRWQLILYFLAFFNFLFIQRLFRFYKWLFDYAWQNRWLLFLTQLQTRILKTIWLLRNVYSHILNLLLLTRIPWCLLIKRS